MYFQRIYRNVRQNGEQQAIRDHSNEYSYSALWQEVCRKRWIAYKRGVTKSTKIILALENSCEWVISFLAFSLLGAKIIPVSPKSKEEYVNRIKEELKADIIIDKPACKDFYNMDIPGQDTLNFPFPDENEEVIYHITSGSTGENKYCIRTLGQLHNEGLIYQEALDINIQDTIVCPLPLCHSFAFGFALLAGLSAGARVVLLKDFIPRQYLNTLSSERATLSLLVPVMARLLSKTFLPDEVDLTCLRYLVVGAGAIPEDVFHSFKERYHISMASNYGSSETGGIITRTGPETFPSIGKPMPGVIVQIRDHNNRIQPPCKEGRIWVKTPSMLSRYHNKADLFDKDGFYYMGDLGYKDEDGNIFFAGREKNLVNIGGKKVNPVFVEQVLLSHPSVKEAVVTGIKRSSGEELLAAVLTGGKGLDQKQVNRYLRSRLETYMIPSIIRISSIIPRDEVGKVKKAEIINLVTGDDC